MTDVERKRQILKEWRKRNPGYHREWMRRYRANPENRANERLRQKLRRWEIQDLRKKSPIAVVVKEGGDGKGE